MKYIYSFLLVFLSSVSIADESKSLVLNFSKEVQSIIASSDVQAFKNIVCHPSNCTDISYHIETVFGNTQTDTPFEKILKANDLRIKITGPYTYNPKWPQSSYTVIFYTVSNSPFDSNGKISEKVGVRELYKSFLQTVVTVIPPINN